MEHSSNLKINLDRLMGRIMVLGEVGALDGGGVRRLALSDEDKAGRDLLVRWMEDLGLEVVIDAIGNITGTLVGVEAGPAVMIGSHIDSVATGGLYDGALGVLAGLEVVETLQEAGIATRRSISVAAFTNEEGARYAPDMMGSAVHQGTLDLEQALQVIGFDGSSLGKELVRIGYDGDQPVGETQVHCFLELHVEQGPVLEREGKTLAAVTGVQGISWNEYTIMGVSNHAGTTPMTMRKDAGVVAAEIISAARKIALDLSPEQVATVGTIKFAPDIVNVVPERAVFTVDLRNIDEEKLKMAEARLEEVANEAAAREGCTLDIRRLVRFEPVAFDDAIVDMVESVAKDLGYSVKRMASGAGHDAQMFAPHCPTAMIFTPSKDGLSHNINEHTTPEDIGAGADVLLNVALQCAGKVEIQKF